MQVLYFPDTFRNSSDCIRVLCVENPGDFVKSALTELVNYLERGKMGEIIGWDANGVQRRFLIDTVGFVCDTHALNSSLDVSGHTGTAPCHLCSIIRASDT